MKYVIYNLVSIEHLQKIEYAGYDKRRYYTFCKLMRTAIERSYGGLQKIDNFRNLYRV